MEKNRGPIVLYKELGETPLQAILRYKKENPSLTGESMTYAGRLDPMAEGLLLVLSGEEIKNKDKYQDLEKTYEAEILWGFETDTLDLLGLVVESHKVHKVEEVQNALKTSIGKFVQKYPAYSSKTVQGKPLFQWAREGRTSEIEIPEHEVEIFEVNFLERRKVSSGELLGSIKDKISKVSGDFRQKEIINKWDEFLKNNKDEFIVDRISLTVSSGFYIRQFVSDLAKNLDALATTFHIKRTKVGDFEI